MAFTSYPWSNVHELNLDWLIKTTKEVSEHIAELEAVREELEKTSEQIKREIIELNNRVSGIEDLYNTFTDDINAEFAELRAENIATFNSLTASINAQFETLETQVLRELANFGEDLTRLETELRSVLNNLPSVIQMVSPYTGEMETLEQIVNELANSGRTDSLTASEYDNLTLTAQSYDNHNLTAYNYDWHGASYLS